MLSDLTQSAVPAKLFSPDQVRFGLRRLDRTWKPAAAVVHRMFTDDASFLVSPGQLAGSRISYDGGFTHDNSISATNGSTGSWATYDAAAAGTIAITPAGGPNNSPAALLQHTGGTISAVPALFQRLLLVDGKRTVTAAAQVRLLKGTGATTIGIAWFDGNTYLGGTQSRAAVNSATTWQKLDIAAAAPAAATSFQIHLKSAHNDGSAYFATVSIS